MDTNPSIDALDAAEALRSSHRINRVFSKKLLAILTGRDAILKENCDCILRNVKSRLKDIHSYWKNMIVKQGCLCLDERIAIPKAIKDSVLEDLHSSHPVSFAMLSLAQNIYWLFIHRDILSKNSKCKA